MGKKKMTRAQAAAARRSSRTDVAERELAVASSPRNLSSKREQLTHRIVMTVQVILVIFPFALVGYSSVAGMGLEEAMRSDPAFAVSFIAAMAQPLFAYRHYAAGDGGYALGNVIGLICAEAFLQNLVGLAGMALILWRMWPVTGGELSEWRERRGAAGVLVDISGALAVLAIGLICAFASWRLSV